MIFTETPLKGAWLITPELSTDSRGFFTRLFDAKLLAKHGMETRIVQMSLAHNKKKRTLRGMHWQVATHAEAKYVQCLRGRVYDVIVDMRKGSRTRLKWYAVELSEKNLRVLYVPKGFLHGYLTLTDDTLLYYSMTAEHRPGSSAGFRWDDPAFGIKWPRNPAVITGKDNGYKDFQRD
jgi:dTDP-4-dehydrorhamnose 3,5-epimerase